MGYREKRPGYAPDGFLWQPAENVVALRKRPLLADRCLCPDRRAGCPYCTGRNVGQGNDLASLYPELAAQWDLRKNAPGKPSDVLAGSHSPAWWLCEKGHS